MKTRTLSILTIAASAAFTATPLFAQATAVTAPVGYRTETITGGVFTLMSPNLLPAISAAGDIESAAGTTLTDSDADFSILPAGRYVLKLTTGTNAGVTAEVTAFPTSTTMTTVQDISTLITADDQYELRAAETVATIFGATNALGLTPGTTTTADIIWIPNGTGGFVRVYYNGTAWRIVGSLTGDGGVVSIFFTDGILIQNQSGIAKDLVFTGHVSTTQTTVAVDAPPLFTFLGRVLPVGITLADSGLNGQITEGTSLIADIIWNPNGAGGYDRYYVQAGVWKKVGALVGNFDGIVLRSGFIAQRQTGVAGNVTLPIPANLDI